MRTLLQTTILYTIIIIIIISDILPTVEFPSGNIYFNIFDILSQNCVVGVGSCHPLPVKNLRADSALDQPKARLRLRFVLPDCN